MKNRKQYTKIMGPDGKPVRLDEIKLVAYLLSCSHSGRDYGIKKGDLLFCDKCKEIIKVSKILAE